MEQIFNMNAHKRLGVMQPYFFPYIGYWCLIQAVDTFVLYDDVQYIKSGYINRNTILSQGNRQRITLTIQQASSNKRINDLYVGENNSKIVKTIQQSYAKAPYFAQFFPVIQEIFACKSTNLADFLYSSIKNLMSYMNMDQPLLRSSEMSIPTGLDRVERLLYLCKATQSGIYINNESGRKLYAQEQFQKEHITLQFIHPIISEYAQLSKNFESHLSIIDLLMNLSVDELKHHLNDHRITS